MPARCSERKESMRACRAARCKNLDLIGQCGRGGGNIETKRVHLVRTLFATTKQKGHPNVECGGAVFAVDQLIDATC